jgi:hypothetical protein
MKRDFLGAALLALALGGAGAAQEATDTTADELKKLREEVERLRREMDEMRKAPAASAPAGEEDEAKALREEAAKEAASAEKTVPGVASAPAPGGAPSLTERLNQFNPRITVFGDFTGRLQLGDHPFEVEDEDSGERKQIDDRISLREVELDLRADIDPFAKGVLILAVEKERADADYGIDVEEGYATLETLPLNFRGKIGRWRQEFGVANNTHRHDLPWFDLPYSTQAFLGEEGVIGDGAALMWLAPRVPLQVQAHVFDPSGWFVTERANEPDLFGRASYFFDVSDRSWLQLGGSVLYGKTTPGGGHDAILAGADLTFKWVESAQASFVLTAELYALDRENSIRDEDTNVRELRNERATGWFVAAQLQPWLWRWYFGARYDADDYFGEVEGNREWALSAFVSYYTTEFLRLRIGYEHREMERGPSGRRNDSFDTLLFQVTWVFGSHPAEPYWVNR